MGWLPNHRLRPDHRLQSLRLHTRDGDRGRCGSEPGRGGESQRGDGQSSDRGGRQIRRVGTESLAGLSPPVPSSISNQSIEYQSSESSIVWYEVYGIRWCDDRGCRTKQPAEPRSRSCQRTCPRAVHPSSRPTRHSGGQGRDLSLLLAPADPHQTSSTLTCTYSRFTCSVHPVFPTRVSPAFSLLFCPPLAGSPSSLLLRLSLPYPVPPLVRPLLHWSSAQVRDRRAQ